MAHQMCWLAGLEAELRSLDQGPWSLFCSVKNARPTLALPHEHPATSMSLNSGSCRAKALRFSLHSAPKLTSLSENTGAPGSQPRVAGASSLCAHFTCRKICSTDCAHLQGGACKRVAGRKGEGRGLHLQKRQEEPAAPLGLQGWAVGALLLPPSKRKHALIRGRNALRLERAYAIAQRLQLSPNVARDYGHCVGHVNAARLGQAGQRSATLPVAPLHAALQAGANDGCISGRLRAQAGQGGRFSLQHALRSHVALAVHLHRGPAPRK